MKKPVHRKPAKKAEAKKGRSYMCRFCGYVYDPAEHHGVAFEDLPANWVCPLCGVGKADFDPVP